MLANIIGSSCAIAASLYIYWTIEKREKYKGRDISNTKRAIFAAISLTCGAIFYMLILKIHSSYKTQIPFDPPQESPFSRVNQAVLEPPIYEPSTQQAYQHFFEPDSASSSAESLLSSF